MARQLTATKENYSHIVIRPIQTEAGLEAEVQIDYKTTFSDGTDQLRSFRTQVQNLTLPASPTAAQAKSALETILAFVRNNIRGQEGL